MNNFDPIWDDLDDFFEEEEYDTFMYDCWV